MKDLYNNKKKIYLSKIKNIREKFEQLYLKTIALGPKGTELYEIARNDKELHDDFKDICENNEDVIFMIRLMNALLYVKDPENEEIMEKLIDDINLTKAEKKEKRKVVSVCKTENDHKWKMIGGWVRRSYIHYFDLYGHPEDRAGEVRYYDEAEFECLNCGKKKTLTKREYEDLIK